MFLRFSWTISLISTFWAWRALRRLILLFKWAYASFNLEKLICIVTRYSWFTQAASKGVQMYLFSGGVIEPNVQNLTKAFSKDFRCLHHAFKQTVRPQMKRSIEKHVNDQSSSNSISEGNILTARWSFDRYFIPLL